jgi:poly(3-hydroxybutyrate) depolymerase
LRSALFSILFISICLSTGISQNLNEDDLTYRGYDRSFYLHVPEQKIPENGFPLVIFLHGFGGNGENGLSAIFQIKLMQLI